jgi:hypothetical protein
MGKNISLFKRDPAGAGFVCDKVALRAEWAANSKGVATREWDGHTLPGSRWESNLRTLSV